MKSIVTLLITIAIISIQFTPAQAQSESLERELAIAESILTEIFKSPSQQPIPAIFGRVGVVSSEYIPGYGVHISIGENISARSIRISGTMQVQRKDGSEETLESNSTSESIKKKIMEYISQYASSMRSLSDNEVLRISYGLRRTADGSIAYITGLQELMDIPKLSFVIKSDDLRRFREGQINENQLKDRVEKQNLSEMESKRDLNIFASVIEASLSSAATTSFRVNRAPTFDYLPGFGVQYHITTTGRPLFNFNTLMQAAAQIDSLNIDDVDINIDLGNLNTDGPSRSAFVFNLSDSSRFEFNLDSLEVNSEAFRESMAEIRIRTEDIRSRAQESRAKIEIHRQEAGDANYVEDAEILKSLLIQTIEDYGSTLTSLSDNEILQITINWRIRDVNLPAQTTFRIKKSDIISGRAPEINEIRRR